MQAEKLLEIYTGSKATDLGPVDNLDDTVRGTSPPPPIFSAPNRTRIRSCEIGTGNAIAKADGIPV